VRHGALGIIGGTLLVAGIALAVVSAVVGHSSATPQQVQLAPAVPGAAAPNNQGRAPGRGPEGFPFVRPPDGNGFGGKQRPGIPFPAPGGSPPASR
jgi:hypothetical protein